jgi:hypothetical protein
MKKRKFRTDFFAVWTKKIGACGPQWGLCCGDFGIWKYSDAELWNVTHIPTGSWVMDCASEQIAKIAVENLLDSGIDWHQGELGKAPDEPVLGKWSFAASLARAQYEVKEAR